MLLYTDMINTTICSLFKLIAILFPTLTLAISKDDNFDANTEMWLQKLDSIIKYQEQYEAEKRQIVSNLVLHRNTLHKPSDIYNANCNIYNECFIFDSALALEAVEANLDYANKIGNNEMIVEWKIKKSFMLSVTGMLSEATDALKGINGTQLTHELQVAYYEQRIYLLAHFGQYLGTNELHDTYKHQETIFRDSLHSIIRPTDTDYIWHCACKAISDGKANSAYIELQKIVEHTPLNSREVASNAYALSQMYKQLGINTLYIQNLIKSAIADLRIANKDIASLEELAGVLYNQRVLGMKMKGFLSTYDNALNRANNYINLCMQKVLTFNNRVRIVSISRIIDSIQHTYIERDIEQRTQLRRNLIVAIALLILLTIASFMMVRMYRKKNNTNKQLAEINQKLCIANDQLQESNFVKEEYIGHMFSLCSNYISKMDEYRKSINRKMKVNQYDDVLNITNKPITQAEMQKFYQDFDTIFLHIYPNFITEFNNLLNPDERIEPKKGELLNTDLRIYALVRLGINDSIKIAKLLHCSPQTVYNNRLKIRNKAIVPKEHFSEYVQQLGRKNTQHN